MQRDQIICSGYAWRRTVILFASEMRAEQHRKPIVSSMWHRASCIIVNIVAICMPLLLPLICRQATVSSKQVILSPRSEQKAEAQVELCLRIQQSVVPRVWISWRWPSRIHHCISNHNELWPLTASERGVFADLLHKDGY